MNAPSDKRRPYVRPMRQWWRRDPFFIGYLAMEATSLLVAMYALILLWGLARLRQGEDAFNAWLTFLASPLSIGLHLLILAVFLYHLWSWFRVMPKTLPMLFIGGRKVSQQTITYSGVIVALGANLAIVAVLTWVWP